jgi:hypothetical protein
MVQRSTWGRVMALARKLDRTIATLERIGAKC